MEVNMEINHSLDPKLTDYEKGREEAKWDAVNDLDGLIACLNFPKLGDVFGEEYAKGYKEYGNAWLVINRA